MDLWSEQDTANAGPQLAQWKLPSDNQSPLESNIVAAVCVNIENISTQFGFDGGIRATEVTLVINMLDALSRSIEHMHLPETMPMVSNMKPIAPVNSVVTQDDEDM